MYLARTEYVTEEDEQKDILFKAKYLIEAGADASLKDNFEKSAVDNANSVNNNVFAEWLRNQEVKSL